MAYKTSPGSEAVEAVPTYASNGAVSFQYLSDTLLLDPDHGADIAEAAVRFVLRNATPAR